MLLHSLANIEVQKYYQNEPKFNGAYLRNNLPKLKGGTYVINLDEYESVGTHGIALYVYVVNAICFDSFGVEYNPKEIKKNYRQKNIMANIYRIQANDLIMCGYFCIGFIDLY